MKPRVLVSESGEAGLLGIFDPATYEVHSINSKAEAEVDFRYLFKTFKPHVFAMDSGDFLNGKFKGLKGAEAVKLVFCNVADRNLNLVEKVGKAGAICLSKESTREVLTNFTEGQLLSLAIEKKERSLTKLLEITGLNSLNVSCMDWKDISDDGYGSEGIFTDLNKLHYGVKVIALKLRHTPVSHGSCISVSYGCPRKCTICKSGNEEIYLGNYNWKYIVGMEELVLRNSILYNSDYQFWLHDMPFFVAVMGMGDIRFNFKHTMRAMDAIHQIFGSRFVCNISTAFIGGVQKLIRYIEQEGKFVPNLQVSLYSSSIESRRLLIDSDENPRDLFEKGLEYSKLTGTEVTYNIGMLEETFGEATTVLDWVKEKKAEASVRIKFSQMKLPARCKLKSVDAKAFKSVFAYAKKLGIKYELFDATKQTGMNSSGNSCGNLLNLK